MLAAILSATLLGIEGCSVVVEVHVANGLPGFTVVGLPDAACREARDRVRAAVLSSGLAWPARRITVNLAPAGVRKEGSSLDLAIAIGVLVASRNLDPRCVAGVGFLGELGLDGSVRGCRGTVSLVEAIPLGTIVVPTVNAGEAALVQRCHIRPVGHLVELVEALRGTVAWPDYAIRIGQHDAEDRAKSAPPDLSEVRGQPFARHALEVAAAGGHHLLLNGPPGAGKTMLAQRLPSILPPLTGSASLEVLRVASAAGLPLSSLLLHGHPDPPGAEPERLARASDSMIVGAPFRAPHHSSSMVSLVGGGTTAMRPGELSCAHRGVLFLDELGEFPAQVLDALRQPLEEGVVRIARARGTVQFPARFLLVAATNPCPCGWGGSSPSEPMCRCTIAGRDRYRRRLSGPILDRFDLRVTVERPTVGELLQPLPAESSAMVAERVAGARALAQARGFPTTAEIPASQLDQFACLSGPAERLLEHHLRVGSLTARGLGRVRRVARTIADLQHRPVDQPLNDEDVAMALELRRPAAFELAAA